MSEFLHNFHFLRPWWLLALLPVLWGWWRFGREHGESSAWAKVCDRNLLHFLLIKGSSGKQNHFSALTAVAAAVAILALSGPAWQKQQLPNLVAAKPVMLLLSLSSDMLVSDVAPDRLTRAKYGVTDIIKELDDAEVGLIVYSGEPYLISPLSEDGDLVLNLLPEINMNIVPENADNLARAIELAVQKIKDAGYSFGNIAVFGAGVADVSAAVAAAKNAAAENYDVSIVAMDALGNSDLARVAAAGEGVYVDVTDGTDKLAQYINRNWQRRFGESRNRSEIWYDFGYYLLWPVMLAVLFLFRRGMLLVILSCLWAFSAQAGWFLNSDQEGKRAFERKDYQTAAEKFVVPDWKASALYRLGKYDDAAKYFSDEDAESLYNRANALAKSGKIDEAIAKYKEVLAQNPHHEDAEFNLQCLEQQKQQQEKQNQQNKNGGSNSQNEKSSSDGSGNNEDNSADSSQSSSGDNKQNSEQSQAEEQQSAAQPETNDRQQEGGGQGKQQSEGMAEQQQAADFGDNSADNRQGQGSGKEPADSNNNPSANSASAQGTQPEKAPASPQNGEEQPEAAEDKVERQLRQQQFRHIPQDNGGLLRALIRHEYTKNRYKDR